jgi:hypothetical protein
VAGTITVSIDSNNTAVLSCSGSSTGANCTHSAGLGQNYTDCNDVLGTPGSPNTYSRTMAADASDAYFQFLRQHPPSPQQVAPFDVNGDQVLCSSDPPNPAALLVPVNAVELAVVIPSPSSPTGANVQITVWAYGNLGGNAAAGHVAQETVPYSGGSSGYTPQCPATSDPTWT